MKIAYVNLHWPRDLESGVGKKIYNQISLWRESGNEVRLFMHMHHPSPNQTLLEGEYFEYNNSNSILDLITNEISRSHALSKLIDSVSSYGPDIIYFRNSMYAYPLHKIFNIAPVTIEIASNDVYEHRQLKFPFSIYNRLTRSIALSKASSMIFLSHELSQSFLYSRFNKPFDVIGDGIPLSKTPFLKAPNNKIPCITFIGSPGKIWHGVDKLYILASLCPDIQFDVIGYDGKKHNKRIPQNIKFLGYLKKDMYINALAKADVALSSLGLHRINIKEISPLKTRECVGLGIPTILPYIDTDLKDLISDKILSISNVENNVIFDADKIRDFAFRMQGKRIEREEIYPYIDSIKKEEQRLLFFKKTVNNFKKLKADY